MLSTKKIAPLKSERDIKSQCQCFIGTDNLFTVFPKARASLLEEPPIFLLASLLHGI